MRLSALPVLTLPTIRRICSTGASSNRFSTSKARRAIVALRRTIRSSSTRTSSSASLVSIARASFR